MGTPLTSRAMFETGNLMELAMKVRHLLVAVSAAAILAGSSFAASAGGWTFSKGESHSSVVSGAAYIHGTPIAITLQHQSNNSVSVGDSWNAGATADAGTHGGSIAIGVGPGGSSGSGAAAWGSTSGSSCAGSGCGNNY
jgi:hypothetical protein